MTVNYSYLVKHTTTTIQNNDDEGIQLIIETPRLTIRSVKEDDIPFFQNLWADPIVMERFATGKPRLYSGTEEEVEAKVKTNAAYDYAHWRIKTSEVSWLNRRKANNIWHGLTVCNKENIPIGHIVLGGGELAYFILPEEWGKGYASEAAVALVGIAMPYISKNYPNIETPTEINATVRTDHIRSQKVLENVGFEINESTLVTEKFGHKRFEVTAPAAKFIEKYNSELLSHTELPSLEVGMLFQSNNAVNRSSETNDEQVLIMQHF